MALVEKSWAASSSAIVTKFKSSHADDFDADVAASLRDNVPKIDALSYVEQEKSSSRLVNELVEAEMAKMARERGAKKEAVDYLAHRPEPPPLFAARGQLSKGEMDRISQGGELEPMSIERYNVEPPEDALANDASAWRAALRNCSAQLEHQANRVVNLELTEAFSEAAWTRHIEDLEKMKAQLEQLVDVKQRECDAINLKRKAEQAALAPEIGRYDQQRVALCAKHYDLEVANAQLRAQIAALLERFPDLA